MAGSMAGKKNIFLFVYFFCTNRYFNTIIRILVLNFFLCVCISSIGMTAVICTYPLDVIRARLAFQVTGELGYTGIGNAFQTIYLKV